MVGSSGFSAKSWPAGIYNHEKGVSMPQRWWPRMAFLASLWTAACATTGSLPDDEWAKSIEGAAVPDFTLREVDGENVSLSSLEHKVVFVLFTREPVDTCPKGDLIEWFDGLYRRQRNRGFEVLFVLTNYRRDASEVLQMKQRCDLAIKVFYDPDRAVTDRFFPIDPIGWYLIGRDQHVVRAGKNYFRREDAQVLQTLLARER
jgi:peroxiredoxin